ncbi:hypothetical protein BC831DRAFT_307334 [Entophlyctis helioformis]|nr:hypothetical protein BC831DRAFT_307334 [Entophlyctis helioformis]
MARSTAIDQQSAKHLCTSATGCSHKNCLENDAVDGTGSDMDADTDCCTDSMTALEFARAVGLVVVASNDDEDDMLRSATATPSDHSTLSTATSAALLSALKACSLSATSDAGYDTDAAAYYNMASSTTSGMTMRSVTSTLSSVSSSSASQHRRYASGPRLDMNIFVPPPHLADAYAARPSASSATATATATTHLAPWPLSSSAPTAPATSTSETSTMCRDPALSSRSPSRRVRPWQNPPSNRSKLRCSPSTSRPVLRRCHRRRLASRLLTHPASACWRRVIWTTPRPWS